MEGWKDGRMEAFRMEGWDGPSRPPYHSSINNASILPSYHSSILQYFHSGIIHCMCTRISRCSMRSGRVLHQALIVLQVADLFLPALPLPRVRFRAWCLHKHKLTLQCIINYSQCIYTKVVSHIKIVCY